MSGLFLGGMLPFLFSSLAMRAVGDAAMEMIDEVRRQFREIPGLKEGNAEPDSATCVDISTKAAIRQMVLPGLIAVVSVLVGFILGKVCSWWSAGWCNCNWCFDGNLHVQCRWCLGQCEEVFRR